MRIVTLFPLHTLTDFLLAIPGFSIHVKVFNLPSTGLYCKMHRALLVQEVVHLIMQSIRYDMEVFEPQGRKALCSAALICSGFLDAAMDALWYNMTSLTPLFKLLSNFGLEYQEKVCHVLSPIRDFLNIVQHHVLLGPILESDLKRFNAYAFHVRRYYCQWHGAGDDVDISAYVHVLQASGHLHIFPRLLDLNIIEAYKDGANTTKIMFLVSPCLHKFSMSGSSTSTAIILNSLQITTPHILCLTLRGVAFIDHYVSVICSLSQLQEISIFKMTVLNASQDTEENQHFSTSAFSSVFPARKLYGNSAFTGCTLFSQIPVFGLWSFHPLNPSTFL